MIRKIPCSAKRIPCFRREQGIRRNALDLRFELMPKGAKTGPRRLIFRKFPDLFPVFRESAASLQAASVGHNRLIAPLPPKALRRFKTASTVNRPRSRHMQPMCRFHSAGAACSKQRLRPQTACGASNKGHDDEKGRL
jgi:hypothetical protein